MNDSSLHFLIKDLKSKSCPLLSKDQEIELAKKIGEGDISAKQKLVSSNIRLAISIAKQYQNRGVQLEDLIQESNIGLIKAAEKFDWNLGFKFSTYASWWIKQACINYINKNSKIIKIPQALKRTAWEVSKFEDAYFDKHGELPSDAYIIQELNIRESVLKNIRHTYMGTAMSLDQNRDDEDNNYNLLNVLFDDALNPEQKMLKEELKGVVINALKTLTPKEEKIFRLRFGFDEVDLNDEMFYNEDD